MILCIDVYLFFHIKLNLLLFPLVFFLISLFIVLLSQKSIDPLSLVASRNQNNNENHPAQPILFYHKVVMHASEIRNCISNGKIH